jgi:hypothetical protein
MTLFALTPASSRGAGKRQVETKFRLSKSKGRTMGALVIIGDDGLCQVEVRATSRELFGFFKATMEIDFISASGQSLHSVQTPPISCTNICGICLRGKLSYTFNLDPKLIKQTDKVRLTSGKDVPATPA